MLGLAAALPAGAQSVVATVTAGPIPIAVVVNSATNKIYVASYSATGQVTVIDGATNATTAIPVGSYPYTLGINKVTNKVYVANSGSASVTVIDGATNATTTIPVGSNPSSIAVNATTNTIYVANESIDGTISVINGATNAVMGNIFAGFNPTAVAVDPTTNTLFAIAGPNNTFTNVPGPTVYAIDPTTQVILEAVVGKPVKAMMVNSASGQLYVAQGDLGGADVVSIADVNANSGGDYPIGGLSTLGQGLDINTVTNVAYFAHSDGLGDVLVVDGGKLTATNIAVGTNPGGVAVDSATNMAYVTSIVSNGTVTAIDGASGLTTTIPVGSMPTQVGVNPVTNKVYVLNNDAKGTVTILNGIPLTVAPQFVSQPQSQTVNIGSAVVFSIAANGRPLPAYQWSLNGVPLSDGNGITGSTGTTLFLANVTAADAGAYTVTATNSSSSVTSSVANLTVTNAADPGRLINLSTRATVQGPSDGTAVDPLIAGFVVAGKGSKSVILRGVGPGLAAFGISDPLPQPNLTLYDSASQPNVITQDTGWQNAPTAPAKAPWLGVVTPLDATAADFSEVGAFALTPGLPDSAVKISLPAGAYTSQISTTGSGSGLVLAEVYDEDQGVPSAQLINISSRALVGITDGGMIAGFVIGGSSAQTVLIRASGPALAEFNLTNPLPDPQLQLFDGHQNLIASNSAWGGNPTIASVASLVGAFAWTNPASLDCALLVTLPPGSYTAQVSPAGDDFGTALVEVYAVP